MHINVSVRVNSKKEFVLDEGKRLVVAVGVPAERGEANKRVIELLQRHFGQSKRVIKIESGHQSPHKVILLEEERV